MSNRRSPFGRRWPVLSAALLLVLVLAAGLWGVETALAEELDCPPGNDCHLAGVDYGDLPGPVNPSYGNTMLNDDGARHIFVANDVILGTRRDADNNGHEDLAAAGDDYTGGMDDEDGVVATGVWSAGPTGGQVWISATGAGCLTAWLDHHPADWDFDDPGEKIFDNQLIATGAQLYTFPLAATPATGVNLYGRFRLVPAVNGRCEEAQIVGVTGAASGGEVEDYLWNFTPTAVRLQAADAVETATLSLWTVLVAIGLTLASALMVRRRALGWSQARWGARNTRGGSPSQFAPHGGGDDASPFL